MRILLFLLMLASSLGPVGTAKAESTDPIKAKFVSLFLNYIDMGGDKKTLCVSSEQEIFSELKSASKKAEAVMISGASELAGCSAVFVGHGGKVSPESVISGMAGKKIVTISDVSGFAAKGGIIELYDKEGKLKFSINLKKANSLGIKLNSKLVELADKTF